MERRRHPSGRPLKRRQSGPLSRPRLPPEEPLTPGLRSQANVNAIGFHADLIASEDSEDEDECRS